MRSRVMLIADGGVPNWSALIRMILTGIVCGCAYLSPVEAAQPLEDARAAYERGDYVEALRLFRPLADQGDAPAQNALGVMYQNGRGVPQDYAETAKWYRKAAERRRGGSGQSGLHVRGRSGGAAGLCRRPQQATALCQVVLIVGRKLNANGSSR